MKKNIIIIFFFCCTGITSFSQNFNYKFCLIQKDAVSIALEFTVCNTTTAPISTFTFVFNWSGVSNVTVDNGLNVLQNGNNGVVEFEQLQWGPALAPGCNNKFTVRMSYVTGMFPPTTGILNGATIPGITCYVPPSYENFECKKNFSDLCFLKTGPEIKIGEGTVRAWNSTLDVYIPTNRKGWAIGMAVAHTMFSNLMGFDCMSVNEYFSTAVQETNCGCDGTVTAPAWATNIYPVNPVVYCSDYSHGVAVGYFQEEYGTGWLELKQDIPCFIPKVDFDTFVVGKRFETQALAKVYHDYNNIAYWQYIKCWNPIGFLKNAKDPYAGEKMISLAYNRGMNSGDIATLLTTSRTAAMAAANILPYLNPPGVGWVYAEQISRVTAVLDNNFASVNPADAAANGVTFPGIHSFHGYYDTQIAWTDISDYLDIISPMYAGVGVNAVTLKNAVQKVFNSINGGNSISFRYQLAPVIDAIVLNLPAFDPMSGLGAVYGNSGGNSCSFPTAVMTKSDTVCPGAPLILTIKLTGTPPWTFSYQDPKGKVVTLNNITTSPYTLTVADTGTYHLISVVDNSGDKGEVVCAPVIKAYSTKGASADLLIVSSSCKPKGLQIKFTGTGPWSIEYSKNGVLQTPINGITQNPYTLIASPAPLGVYVLTRLLANGCDITLKDTAIVDSIQSLNINISGNTSICMGQSTTLWAHGGILYTWSNGLGTDSIISISPTVSSTYTVYGTNDSGCTGFATVHVNVVICSISANTNGGKICQGGCFTLTASGSGGTAPYKYSWSGGQSTQGITVCPTVSTTYTVSVTDQNGATASDTALVFVRPLVLVNTSKTDVLCNGGKTGTATALPVSGSSPYIYVWNPSGGNSSAATGLSAGNYSVTVTDANGCSNVSVISITEPLAISVSATSTQTSCKVNDGTASASASNGIVPYIYNWNNGQTASIATGLGAGVYSVTVTDANGCIRTQTVSVTQISGPIVTANTSASSISPGGNTSLTATGGGTYLWSPVNGLSCSTCANTAATLDQTTSYCVLVTDANTCTASTCITIMVEEPCGSIYVPNAFSPNNDLENDMECVMGGCVEYMYIAIFSRWGEKVFESSDQKVCWDGTYHNKLQDAAVYNYYLRVTFTNGKKVSKKGNISLVR